MTGVGVGEVGTFQVEGKANAKALGYIWRVGRMGKGALWLEGCE